MHHEFFASEHACRPRRIAAGIQWRVWAPRAEQPELVLLESTSNGDRGKISDHQETRDSPSHHRAVPLEPAPHGYWQVTLPEAAIGTRYAYRLRPGGPLRPDPCAVWQPDGVHRPSALYFPEDFAWQDARWSLPSRDALVFYELHVGTFTPEGTFEAIIPRLPALRELGITALELLPVSQFPGARNWGYDGAHLFAPQHSYGGPQGLQRLVDAAHAGGMAVILDLVLNHFGPEGNYVAEFAPYYSTRYTTPWGPAFNFDGRESDPVRSFVLENIWHWIADFRLDGLRLDAVHAMYDNSPEHILSDIKRCADAAAATRGGRAVVIAESLMNDVRMVKPRTQGGYALDAEWNEDFHHALVAYLTGERHGKYVDFGTAEQLPRVLEQTFSLSGAYSQFRGRRWGAPAGELSGEHFVIGTQNHDHVGNRACGERLSTLVTPPVARLAASLMLLAPYLPLIFMGEEYAEPNPFLFFCSFEDAGLIENVRQGRARDYELEGPIPDPQAESSFEASRLSWDWQGDAVRSGLRQLYRDLLAARRQWPELRDFVNRSARLCPEPLHATLLELVRGGKTPHAPGTLTCYFNLTDRPQVAPAPAAGGDAAGEPAILFRSEELRYGSQTHELGLAHDVLRPFECVVWGPSRTHRHASEL
jgi:maltooligosyltrehalose trehalohydrolase